MISILVAVYNAAQWLEQCLDSLCAQTVDMEAICVDDCSTDSSWEILQRYAAADSRIRVYHLEENRGFAHARNVAMQHACGEWIMMLDADDWISSLDSAAQIAQHAEEDGVDSILLQCHYVYPDGREEPYPLRQQRWTGSEAAHAALSWEGIHGLYLVRRDLQQRFPYDASARLYSDENTTRLHYLHSRCVATSDVVYYYRQHAQSATHTALDAYFDHLTAGRSLQQALADDTLASDELKHRLIQLRWRRLTDCWHHYLRHRCRLQHPAQALALMHAVYRELIYTMPVIPARWPFGYWTLRPYALYVLQQRIYYGLRCLLRRVK